MTPRWPPITRKRLAPYGRNLTVDSSSVRALRGGKTGPNPTDRRKKGSKHHLLTEARDIPLTAIVTGANLTVMM